LTHMYDVGVGGMPVIALIMWSKTGVDNGKNNETIDNLTICARLKKHSDGLHNSLNGYGTLRESTVRDTDAVTCQ
jgi:hypothetical protein